MREEYSVSGLALAAFKPWSTAHKALHLNCAISHDRIVSNIEESRVCWYYISYKTTSKYIGQIRITIITNNEFRLLTSCDSVIDLKRLVEKMRTFATVYLLRKRYLIILLSRHLLTDTYQFCIPMGLWSFGKGIGSQPCSDLCPWWSLLVYNIETRRLWMAIFIIRQNRCRTQRWSLLDSGLHTKHPQSFKADSGAF